MSIRSTLLALLLTGCELDGSGSGQVEVGISGSSSATARTMDTDLGLSADAQLFLNVEAIRVRHEPAEELEAPCSDEDGAWDEDDDFEDDEDGGWETIHEGFVTVNLSDPMSSHEDPIAIAELPEGDIHELRLVLSASEQATLVTADGQEQPVTVPSGSSSGLKLKGCMPVREGQATLIDVGVGLAEALHETGSGEMKLQPSLKVSWALVPDDEGP